MRADEIFERCNEAFNRTQRALERGDKDEFERAAAEHEGYAQMYKRETTGALIQ